MDLRRLRGSMPAWLGGRAAPVRPPADPVAPGRRLVRPVMVAAFEGWNDAGEAASAAVVHLARAWSAEPLAEIDGEEFFDFTEVRPEIAVDDAGERSILWPSTTLALAAGPAGGRDVILVSGPEPQLHWKGYCETFVELAESLGVEQVVTLGAHLAEITHKRAVPLSGSVSASELLGGEITPSRYEGPTGIVGVLGAALADAGLATASLWASVPAYSLPVSPRAARDLVAGVARLVGRQADTTELELAGLEYDRRMDELVLEDENVAAYVARIAELEDEERAAEELSADDLAAEVERYLRNNRPG